jgi:hypothetical protein
MAYTSLLTQFASIPGASAMQFSVPGIEVTEDVREPVAPAPAPVSGVRTSKGCSVFRSVEQPHLRLAKTAFRGTNRSSAVAKNCREQQLMPQLRRLKLRYMKRRAAVEAEERSLEIENRSEVRRLANGGRSV